MPINNKIIKTTFLKSCVFVYYLVSYFKNGWTPVKNVEYFLDWSNYNQPHKTAKTPVHFNYNGYPKDQFVTILHIHLSQISFSEIS